jgi:hypothetical protein
MFIAFSILCNGNLCIFRLALPDISTATLLSSYNKTKLYVYFKLFKYHYFLMLVLVKYAVYFSQNALPLSGMPLLVRNT